MHTFTLHSFLCRIFLLILLIPSIIAYPNCNPELYGTPWEDDCHDIFFDRPYTGNKGLASLDKKSHYFGAVGNPRSRPRDVGWKEWSRRVDLPRTWHDGECSALLAPSLYSNGQPKYDTGTYENIAEAASNIEMVCAGTSRMHRQTGLMIGGSLVNGAGSHHRLTLILYHPHSRFADLIRADVAAMRIVDYGAIGLDTLSTNSTNKFLEHPKTGGSGDRPESSSSGNNRPRRIQYRHGSLYRPE